MMSAIQHLQGIRRKIFLGMIEFTVLSVLVCGLFGIYQTFGNVSAPIVLHDPAIINVYPIDSSKFKHAHEVHITRDVEYKEIVPAVFSTQLINKDLDYTVDLQDTMVASDKIGTVKTHKLYYVSHLPPGKWCVQTSVYWTPVFSTKERVITSDESCFVVGNAK